VSATERPRSSTVPVGFRPVFDVHRVDVEFVGEPLGRDEGRGTLARRNRDIGGEREQRVEAPVAAARPSGAVAGDSSSVSGSTAS